MHGLFLIIIGFGYFPQTVIADSNPLQGDIFSRFFYFLLMEDDL
jgi:hypothetical protein